MKRYTSSSLFHLSIFLIFFNTTDIQDVVASEKHTTKVGKSLLLLESAKLYIAGCFLLRNFSIHSTNLTPTHYPLHLSFTITGFPVRPFRNGFGFRGIVYGPGTMWCAQIGKCHLNGLLLEQWVATYRHVEEVRSS